MKKNALKERLRALQVAKPLRFETPKAHQEEPSGQTDHRTKTPEALQPPRQSAQGAKDLEGKAPTGHDSLSLKSPEGETPTRQIEHGVDRPVVTSPTGNVTKRRKTHSATCPVGDLNRYVPKDRGDQSWRERNDGSFHIPHRLFEFLNKATKTRNDLVVLNCLLRYTLGFRRKSCEASYSLVSDWTGIQDVTSIKRAIKSLRDSGLIVRTREPDSIKNLAAIYEIPVLDLFLPGPGKGRKVAAQNAGSKEPSGQTDQRAREVKTSGQNAERPLGVAPSIKRKVLNKTLKKSLSDSISKALQKQIDETTPDLKRKAEKSKLKQLLGEFSQEEIELALNFVMKFGALGTGEKIHSPFGYLSVAISDVLKNVKPKSTNLQVVAEPMPEANSTETNMEDALATFEKMVSKEERKIYVDRFASDMERESKFLPPEGILRRMAACQWIKERSQGEQLAVGI